MEKGLRELPILEQTWQEENKQDPGKAEALLNDYTADFFGATIARWDEMARYIWRQTWTGV